MSGTESLEETQARLAHVAPADAAPRPPRKRGPLIIGLTVAALAVAGASVGVFIAGGIQPGPDWGQYPGTAYRDDADVLAGDSMETVVATNDAALAEIRQALTDQYGMTWTLDFDETIDQDYNYYGGRSMLYFWNTGMWRGTATTTDPDARQNIQDLVERVTNAAGGTDFYAWNDLLTAGDALTLEQYGLGEKLTQAHWELRNSDPVNGVVTVTDVLDRSLRVGDTFVGDDSFLIPEGSTGTLFVSMFSTAGGLLSEADRAEFIDRIEPYQGHTKPDPTG